MDLQRLFEKSDKSDRNEMNDILNFGCAVDMLERARIVHASILMEVLKVHRHHSPLLYLFQSFGSPGDCPGLVAVWCSPSAQLETTDMCSAVAEGASCGSLYAKHRRFFAFALHLLY